MNNFQRRGLLSAAGVLGVATAARAATFGNPDSPPQGAVNTKGSPQSLTDPGPKNPVLMDQFPSFQDPPATDVDGMPLFWASFNDAHKRIQNGGWAREVTQLDFAISESISGVNMRLSSGGIREMHWHQQAEWAIMLTGKCRITTLDELGRPSVEDVEAGDLWYFSPGLPHSLQGLGPDGAEFLIAFDNGMASEFNTLLLTDWVAHTPPEVLAKNFGVSADVFRNIPLKNLWIFQGKEPPALAADRQSSKVVAGAQKVVFRLASKTPDRQTRSGTVRIADSRNFPISQQVAAALVTVAPGGMRELHWHPNADEWTYFIKGCARATVFNTGPKAQTADFRPGDIGYIKRGLGHYVENTGTTELQFLEVFKADHFAEVSLSDWLTHVPPELVAQHLNIDPSTIVQFPQDRPDVVPE
ncbi:cupin domain-containing protein [Nguyenibacter vanlangensis]|uniref:Cupin domain-containing protein n=1 Tax=Nguyenibacter vanlangensis TaxID=1216886 RepID=A0A7Y7M6F5_9PROT|nr:cupin domain-containing protein [Nguyenibacter vanlangensis]NVN10661.1 cupin domain-containing protein [Nguyenibacter vanlangensis]